MKRTSSVMRKEELYSAPVVLSNNIIALPHLLFFLLIALSSSPPSSLLTPPCFVPSSSPSPILTSFAFSFLLSSLTMHPFPYLFSTTSILPSRRSAHGATVTS
mmetsp:Transcript_29458/g.76033  ORF Transcript_29458/g.76033 Transcript_29458/m.76033 type:complete len:103 (+) Transcript_29458:2394-2702(+)